MGGAERFAFNGEAERAAEGDETEEDEIQEVISPGSLAAAAFDAPPVLGAHYAMPYCLRMAVVKKKGASPVYNMGDFCFHDDQQAKLLFIVSARNEHTRSRRVLLDSSGVPIFVAQRKMLSFYNRWDAYRGESAKEEDALFSVQKSAYFQVKMSFNVYLASLRKDSKKPSFKVKGNYHGRDCRVLCGSQVVAEVKMTCARHIQRDDTQQEKQNALFSKLKGSMDLGKRSPWEAMMMTCKRYKQTCIEMDQSSFCLPQQNAREEVKKGEADSGLASQEKFLIIVQPGIDYAFIAGLILIMDEIHREIADHRNQQCS